MSKPKVRVQVKFPITTAIDNFMTDEVANEIGVTLKSGITDALSKGMSPVEGQRRLAPYKNPTTYPGKDKPKTPVNLYRSGALYAAFEWFLQGSKFVFGIFDPKVAVYAKAHNEGTDHMARRQIIPGEGERFSVTIQRKVLAVYEKRMKAILNK